MKLRTYKKRQKKLYVLAEKYLQEIQENKENFKS